MDWMKSLRKIFNENRTLTLTTQGKEGPWSAKTFFAEKDGYIYVALENSTTYRNIKENPQVVFVIERGKPDRFLQGIGIAEDLGKIDDVPEKHLLLNRNMELLAFIRFIPDVHVIRIKPVKLFVSDFSGEWKPRMEVDITDDVLREFAIKYPVRSPLWKRLFLATRPFSFTVTIFSILIGSLLAPQIDGLWLLLTLLGGIFVHAAINVLSDYNDWKRGADTWRVLGSSRMLVDKQLSPKALLLWGWLLFLVAISIGISVYFFRTEHIGWIILAGAFLGLFYTMPPIGLKYRALGDIAVFLAFGPLMSLGAWIIQTQEPFSWEPVLASIPLGLLTIAILHANNYRDIEDDRRAGYVTMAGLLGPRGSAWYYTFLIIGAYVSLLAVVLAGYLTPWALLAFLSLPWAIKNIKIALRPQRVAFFFLDLLTAQLHMFFGLFMTAGLLLDRTGWFKKDIKSP